MMNRVLNTMALVFTVAGFVAWMIVAFWLILAASAIFTASHASAHVCIGSHETMCKHHD